MLWKKKSNLEIIINGVLLKPSQNKKVKKNPGAVFSVFSLKLAPEKKTLKTVHVEILLALLIWNGFNDWSDIRIVKSEKKRVMLNELFLPQQSFCWIGIRVWIRVKPQSAKAARGQLEHIWGKYFLKLQSYFFFISVWIPSPR